MRALMTIGLLAATGISLATTNVAWALPSAQTVTFTIHEDPEDPQSPIAYKVELDMTPDDSDGDSIGWEILEARIIKKEAGGYTVWSESSPSVDTPDGLWWIDHADGENPHVSEFVIAPPIEGTATPEETPNADLDYSLIGDIYIPPLPPDEPPFAVTGSLSYTFWRSGEPAPDAEAEDIPAETDSDDLEMSPHERVSSPDLLYLAALCSMVVR